MLTHFLYQLMQVHGRFDLCVELAKLNNNYEIILSHYINEENYVDAIKNIENIKDLVKRNDLTYKYCHILLAKQPK